jgi:hypothetical protein
MTYDTAGDLPKPSLTSAARHRRVMSLKFTPPLDWRSTLTCLSPRAIPESRSDVVFDYDERTSAEDLFPVLQSLSGSASTPHNPLPMAPGEWNGNHNDQSFLMVGGIALLCI